jgi:hypothetical protein
MAPGAKRAKMMVGVGIAIAATDELAAPDRPMVGNLRRFPADDADRVKGEKPRPPAAPAGAIPALG